MSRFRSQLRLLSTTVLFLTLAAAAQAKPRVVTIAQARTLPLGTLVTVSGSVSTPSGVFNSSFFDQGFGLQDDDKAGIFISLQTDLHVAPRAQARVTGILKDASGLLVIAPAKTSDVEIHHGGPTVASRWVDTSTVGEITEGRIVRVVGIISQAVTSDLPFGYKFQVDDGSGPVQIFVNTGTGIDTTKLKFGQLISVTGFSSQFETHYEIDPRGPNDLDVPWTP
ncbi:MAG TPA: hypothetical protein VGK45_15700 [Thermoanaerobaculia bacterium]